MKSSTIQTIVVGIFILFAVVGVIIFATTKSDDGSDLSNVEVTVWGILPKEDVVSVIERVNTETPGLVSLDYIEKTTQELEQDLTAALLDQTNIPDGLLISQEELIKFQKRLTLIAWTAISERDMKDNYVEAAEIFFADGGTYAIPFLIDPLVLYWNRDTFNSKAVNNPPQKWEDLVAMAPKFNERYENRTIKKSVIAIGEYQNIMHAKSILAALNLQVGGTFVKRVGEMLDSEVMETKSQIQGIPLEIALQFYTQFTDPATPIYSWSRALPGALQMFLQGDSAMYIGFGSEADDLRVKNPNLNFDLAVLPQTKSNNDLKTTYAKIYGFAIVNQSPYKDAMLRTALQLTGSDLQREFALQSNRAPVRRDLVSVPPGSSTAGTIWQSAFWSRGWLDPNPSLTSSMFKEMIESVTTGRAKVSEAVGTFSEQLKELLDQR